MRKAFPTERHLYKPTVHSAAFLPAQQRPRPRAPNVCMLRTGPTNCIASVDIPKRHEGDPKWVQVLRGMR